MKYSFSLLLLSFFTSIIRAQPVEFRTNQAGYYPEADKIIIVAGSKDNNEFQLINDQGQVVYQAKLSKSRYWKKSGEWVQQADFSAVGQSGIFRLKVGDATSDPFRIGNDVWRQVSVWLLRSYFLQRASFPLEASYADRYQRPAGHPDTTCVFHPSTGKSGLLNAPGGWYDAGDFGKYIVSAGVTLGNMLSLYEMMPGIFPDGAANIPESGNGISDLLDEAKYELDWFKHMQDEDGGVFVKITTEKYPDMMFPHQDTLARNVYGKSTAATLHFAAVMAMAARIYNSIWPAWSSDCRARAERAWQWAISHPDKIFSNPPGVLSGAYSNHDTRDEFYWAAAELYITSSRQIYFNYLMDHLSIANEMEASGWANVSGLAITSLAIQSDIPEQLFNPIQNALISWSDEQLTIMENSAYRLPNFSFVWGSNGFAASAGLVWLYTYRITGDTRYLQAAAGVADYILGKNATGYCFITGFGDQQVTNLHHSVSIADGIPGSLPGFVPGGPNPGMQDATPSEHGAAARYPSNLPAKAYVDHNFSYASNENDICYSAPVLALIAGLDLIFGEDYPQDWSTYFKIPSVGH